MAACKANKYQRRERGQLLCTFDILIAIMMPLLLSSLLCCLSMLIEASTAAKMAFILTPRHHHNCQPSSLLPVHRRSDVRIYSITRSNNLRLNAVNDNDDDDSICDVYQQVKEEDSDWYSKISEMLGDDELLDTTFSCGDGKEIEMSIKPIETSKQDPGDDDRDRDDQSSKEDANDINLQKRNIEEAPIQESPTEFLTENGEAGAPNSQEESIEISQVAARHSEGHYTQFLDQDNEEEDMDIAEEFINKEMRSKAKSKDSAVNVDLQQQQSQIDEKERRQKNEEPSSSYIHIVRIYNEFTKEYENVAPLSALEKLGYKAEELQLLRPQVLELIVDDRIPMPRRGIPKRWLNSKRDDQYDEDEARYDDDFGWQVQVVSRKKRPKREVPENSNISEKARPPVVEKENAFNDSEKDEPTESRQSDPSSRVNISSSKADSDKAIGSEHTGVDSNIEQSRQQKQQQQQQQPQQQREQQYPSDYEQDLRRKRGYRPKRSRQPQTVQDDKYNDRANSRRSRRQRGSVRRQRTPKQQELLIERDSYSDDPSGNKFWMDLPVFKDFLRKEAQFRLQILGPDWKESVLDESRWRYDLYKTWLQMIDEGVGENPLYTYTENPRGSRRRSRSRSEANYEREYNARDSSRRRVPRSQAEVKKRRVFEDDEESGYERQERKRNEQDDDTEQRRRTRIRERSRNEQRPRRQRRPPQSPRAERWTNFNDLEESLLKSKGESQGYSQRSVDSYDDEIPRSDAYDDEEYDEDELPRRRYSTDAYDESFEEEDRQPQRRRRRARRDMTYDKLDDDVL